MRDMTNKSQIKLKRVSLEYIRTYLGLELATSYIELHRISKYWPQRSFDFLAPRIDFTLISELLN